jgi:hypothetical protein
MSEACIDDDSLRIPTMKPVNLTDDFSNFSRLLQKIWQKIPSDRQRPHISKHFLIHCVIRRPYNLLGSNSGH